MLCKSPFGKTQGLDRDSYLSIADKNKALAGKLTNGRSKGKFM